MNSSMIYCSHCGAGNQSRATYCFSCGKLLQIGTLPDTSGTGCLSPRQMLRQRYRIVTLVGQGGMGAVYKAEDIQFGGRLIAVKEMSQNNLSPQEATEAVEQFKQEAHLLAALKHPNLPSIYDYFGENGRWYLVMDFIEGTTLKARLDQAPGHILSMTETLDIGIQLAKVLGYLHTRPTPIIFRDLKPLNIMITPEDNVYLIDFGIARLFKPGKAKDTVAYVSAGYAAPEQFGRAQTSPQSDIYSLGATLHQLLSGNNPSFNTPMFTFQSLKMYSQNIPTTLANLISTMLNMDPTRRPKSMAVVRQELEHIQTVLKQPVATPVPPTQYAPPPPPPPAVQRQYVPPPPPPLIVQAAQGQRQAYQTSSPQEVAKPALPKGIVWKTLLIGVVMAVYLIILVPITHYNSGIWLTTAILSLLVAGFITGKVVILRRAVFFMGCIAAMILAIAAFFSSSTSAGIILLVVLMLVSGVICLIGGWLGTIGHPYYKKP